MSRLFVVDPDLGAANFGHHAASGEEIARAADELGFAVTFYCSTDRPVHASAAGEQGSIATAAVPTFSVSTYLPDPGGDDRLDALLTDGSALDAEYDTIPFDGGACVLVTTASPWHLVALAKRLLRLPRLRVAVGMLLPPNCWTRDARLQVRVDSAMQSALADLAARHHLFVYSETGVIKWSHRSEPTQVLFQPVSDFTLQQSATLRPRAQSSIDGGALRFGFFGQPRPEKAFDLIVGALRSAASTVRDEREVLFFLPESYDALAGQINQDVPHARAWARSTDNLAFLADMAAVDVVLCFYDAVAYADQMSGIAAEAVLVGKPVLTTRHTALEAFLARYAPGSSFAADFTPAAFVDAVNADACVWRQRTRAAQASAPVVRELKSARRFFRCAFDLPVQ